MRDKGGEKRKRRKGRSGAPFFLQTGEEDEELGRLFDCTDLLLAGGLGALNCNNQGVYVWKTYFEGQSTNGKRDYQWYDFLTVVLASNTKSHHTSPFVITHPTFNHTDVLYYRTQQTTTPHPTQPNPSIYPISSTNRSPPPNQPNVHNQPQLLRMLPIRLQLSTLRPPTLPLHIPSPHNK